MISCCYCYYYLKVDGIACFCKTCAAIVADLLIQFYDVRFNGRSISSYGHISGWGSASVLNFQRLLTFSKFL